MLHCQGEDDIVKSVRAVGAFSCLTGIELTCGIRYECGIMSVISSNIIKKHVENTDPFLRQRHGGMSGASAVKTSFSFMLLVPRCAAISTFEQFLGLAFGEEDSEILRTMCSSGMEHKGELFNRRC